MRYLYLDEETKETINDLMREHGKNIAAWVENEPAGGDFAPPVNQDVSVHIGALDDAGNKVDGTTDMLGLYSGLGATHLANTVRNEINHFIRERNGTIAAADHTQGEFFHAVDTERVLLAQRSANSQSHVCLSLANVIRLAETMYFPALAYGDTYGNADDLQRMVADLAATIWDQKAVAIVRQELQTLLILNKKDEQP